MAYSSGIKRKGLLLEQVKVMKITVWGKQMNVRESLEILIRKKLHKFDKFFGDDTEAAVTCKVRKDAKIIEITILYGSTVFRAEAESDTFITALDRAAEGLERQIRKNKTRLEKQMRSGAFVIEEEDDDEFEEEGDFEIRVKSFPFKPMSPEEAILQMNLLGHDFFAFTDAAVGDVCVVYKRKGGGYGMIVPEK
jgi:putative sigma-54 modulation protein